MNTVMLDRVAVENLGNPSTLRRFLVRVNKYLSKGVLTQLDAEGVEMGSVLLVVDSAAVGITPAGTHDSIRDNELSNVHYVRSYYWADHVEVINAELERLGGEYNP